MNGIAARGALPFRYFAHGLGIHSEAPLRNAVIADAPCDVTVRFAPVPAPTSASLGEALIRFADGVIYSIRDGRNVTAYTTLPITSDSAEFLGGNALAIVLQQRGQAVLHASAAIVDGCAVALAGPSGAGKSTLLAALLQRGHSILADDFIAFPVTSESSELHRGFAQVRLLPDSAHALDIALRTNNESPKATWHIRDNKSNAHLPAPNKHADRCTILFLNDSTPSSAITAERLTPHEALFNLLSNSYCGSLLDRDDLRDEFIRWTAVAKDVTCYRLTRPLDFAKLPDVVDVIQSLVLK